MMLFCGRIYLLNLTDLSAKNVELKLVVEKLILCSYCFYYLKKIKYLGAKNIEFKLVVGK